MKTLKLRIRDKHTEQLNRLSGSVNFVWNYVNDLSYKHLQRTGKFFSAYNLNEYTKGANVELCGTAITLAYTKSTLARLYKTAVIVDMRV